MSWRLPPSVYRAGKGAKNRRALKRIVTESEPPGVLGYLGGKPVAWCAVAPRTAYSFLERSRVLSPVDDLPVWSISCLFVEKTHRRRGLSAPMLRAAAEFAGRRGARFVEGYPTIPYSEKVPDPFLWTGTLAAFREAGYVEVARRSKGRPIMRSACPASRWRRWRWRRSSSRS
jgi:GNAT superfamily N-acetyltransferase